MSILFMRGSRRARPILHALRRDLKSTTVSFGQRMPIEVPEQRRCTRRRLCLVIGSSLVVFHGSAAG
jgi:hypothetical protein